MATPKTNSKRCYFEAIDLIINCIQDRFDHPGYRMYHLLETLLLKACKQEELEESLDAVCKFYKDEFHKELRCSHLQTLGMHFQEVEGLVSNAAAIFGIKKYFVSLSSGQAIFFPKSDSSCS